jgi:cytosol alanyl aminopeptidase
MYRSLATASCLAFCASCAGAPRAGPTPAKPADPAAAAPAATPPTAPSAPAAPEAAPAAAAPTTSSPAAPGSAGEQVPELQLPRDVRPTRYALSMTLAPKKERFSGTAEIQIELDRARQIIWLHGRDLHVTAATAQPSGGEALPAKYEQVTEEGVVKLTLPRAIGPGAATLRLAWSRPWEPKLIGAYLAHEAGAAYAFTMFEPVDARRAFPCFDEPVFKTPFEVTLTVPAGDVAVANTLPSGAEEQLDGGMKRIRFSETKPLPTYLIAWAVGPFDVVDGQPLPANTLRARPVPVRGVAPRGRGKELAYALKIGNELILGEEQYFGIPYPYDKLDHVAVPDFAYGAEENAGEIHYREQILLFEEGKSSEDLRTTIAGVMAHEMAHQWFGDLVTMRWWDDTWLNESFATWMGHRVVDVWDPQMQSGVDLLKATSRAMGNDSLVTARAIRQPIESIKDVWNQFDGLTYQKGGGVLAMFERFIGAKAFRKGVSNYLTAHAFRGGSTGDLLASLSAAAKRDLVGPFHTFLDQAGVPNIEAQVSCTGGAAKLALRQSRYLPLGSKGDSARTWQVPICARYGVAGNEEQETCTLLSEPQGTLKLGPTCPDWVLPNAAGAGYYRWALGGEDLRKLRTAGYAHLSVPERISLAQNLRAAVFRGSLPVADALAALEPIARDPNGEVATEPMGLIAFTRENLVEPAQRPLVEAYLRELYLPAFRRLGWTPAQGETTSVRRLRAAVIGELVRAKEGSVRREAVARGLSYAGLADGKLHPEAVDADLAEIALAAAVEDGGAAIFDALSARLAKTDDAEVRGRIIGALSSARDPARSARALALARDSRLRTNERLRPIFHQARDPRTRERAWRYVRNNFDALVPKIPENFASEIPSVADGFCDAAHLAQVEAFFGPRADKIPSMPRNLAQTLEQMRLCIAQAAAQRSSARRFFATARRSAAAQLETRHERLAPR